MFLLLVTGAATAAWLLVIGTATSLPNLQDIVATLVVAARVRNDQEETVIRQILATVFKRTVDPEKLLSLGEETSSVTRPLLSASTSAQFPALAWTRDMRRMGVLVAHAWIIQEPVLLVGDWLWQEYGRIGPGQAPATAAAQPQLS